MNCELSYMKVTIKNYYPENFLQGNTPSVYVDSCNSFGLCIDDEYEDYVDVEVRFEKVEESESEVEESEPEVEEPEPVVEVVKKPNARERRAQRRAERQESEVEEPEPEVEGVKKPNARERRAQRRAERQDAKAQVKST